ncbi:type VI secretion system baseplate subunit TssF [Methylococcus sp. EFPC2]|uniref:type VI secretion system baseplate subunit TssF n=1 Tax=Methylococcus sp. EFPC2 TaxID=2812648 RepID=UPI0019681734|nr:type VI secretion system baseplate subunit TssF [Methylococcus sp. EFPC2]QSA96400.1 type VI secretion system baseplate subunit TssF [Methylococcus sp. EFPC2]
MDPRLLSYYNRELQHLREVGAEFAKEFPKVAGRIGLDEFECADPYVERLLEGFAFLAARVQLKVDAEFPNFTQHLLEIVYPHYLAQTPSMAVAQFQPDLKEGALAQGFKLPRGTTLRSQIAKGEQTACEYRTAHDLTLLPLQLSEAEYLANPSAVANLGVPSLPGLKSGLRLRIKTSAGLRFNQLALSSLPLFLRGTGELPVRLYEQLIAHGYALAIKPVASDDPWVEIVRQPGRRMGFDDGEALLPVGPRSFQGYRLLHEYFAFPERFLFVELQGLDAAVRRCRDTELDLIVMFDNSHPGLVNAVDANQFALFCSPIINLFPKRCDRIHLNRADSEYHIVPDRTRPMDFEAYSIVEATGYGSTQGQEQGFLPFYGSKTGYSRADETGYYMVRRRKRLLSSKQRREGQRSSYVGSEVYLSLVDANQAPYGSDLKQLGLQTWCTNRDLPLVMPVGVGTTDFTLEVGAPVQAIRCLAGPTKPAPSRADGGFAWRLISHLSLNYLSLADSDAKSGAAALRELLTIYGERNDVSLRKQIEGVLSCQARNVVRRIDAAGPIVFGRGLEITVTFDESSFEGSGVFLIGAVLEQFFARYASINSFTETVIRSSDRGEIMKWPIRVGQRPTI